MGGNGSGDRDLGEDISGWFAFWGVEKRLVDPSEPEKEKSATCFCLFFEGEKGLDAEAVSVFTARDLGMIDIGISDFGVTERGGVQGGTREFSGSDRVAFTSLESFL